MKIIHVLEDYSFLSGGIRTVVRNLHHQLSNHNHESYIVTPYYEKRDKNDNLIVFQVKKNHFWTYSNHFKLLLEDIYQDSKIDVIHIHGVWMFPQYYAAKFALKKKIPFVISFHGMYEPWLWTRGYYKKLIYSKLMTNAVFKKASAMHSITKFETKDLQTRFKNTRIIEIPNLINVSQTKPKNTKYNKSNYILFLGRLDPKKGINLLIDAYVNLNQKEKYSLKIAGPLNDYQKVLKQQVKQLSLDNKVEFLGPVDGEAKQKLFEEALVFVSPSFSEVIGMVNLEAALSKTIVITTHQTGIDEAWSSSGGYLINPEAEEIKRCLELVLSMRTKDRQAKEIQLRNFVLENYSWKNRYKYWENFYLQATRSHG